MSDSKKRKPDPSETTETPAAVRVDSPDTEVAKTPARGEDPDSAEQRTPAQIEADIAQTREQLGETVEALAAKADVKGQAKQKVDETKQQARAKIDDAKQSAQATPAKVQASARQGLGKAKQNPALAAVAATALVAIVVIARRRGR